MFFRSFLFAEHAMEPLYPNPGVMARGSGQLEPLAVSPRQACLLLGVGNTRLYQLIGNGELQSYREGRARRITLESIRGRVARKLADERAIGAGAKLAAPRRRGPPRKLQEAWHHES